MKLLYIANIRLPTEKAHGTQIMKMCEAFSTNGCEVLLAVSSRSTGVSEDPFEYYNVKKNFSIFRLPSIDAMSLGKFGFFLAGLSFSVSALLFCLKEAKKSGGFDVYYSRDIMPLFLLSFLARFKKKLVWEAHMGHWNFLLRRIIKISKVITISDGLKKFFINKMPDPSRSRIFVAHDAVDLEQFKTSVTKEESRKVLGLPLDKKIAMYIGLFDEWKGYRTVLEANSFLAEGIELAMIGGSDDQVKSLRVKYPRVIFLGYKKYSFLPEHQRAADVLLIPNSGKYDISKYFTSPLKLFAHMASGVPIIASDLPSLREILNENNAFFFKPDDARALAEAVSTVVRSEEISGKISMGALKDVEKYTWNARASGIIKNISS